jgi:hypothetical protein
MRIDNGFARNCLQRQKCLSCPVTHYEDYTGVEFRKICGILLFFFSMAQQPPVGQGFLIIEASRSHSDTPLSVGLLWTSDEPDAETST